MIRGTRRVFGLTSYISTFIGSASKSLNNNLYHWTWVPGNAYLYLPVSSRAALPLRIALDPLRRRAPRT